MSDATTRPNPAALIDALPSGLRRREPRSACERAGSGGAGLRGAAPGKRGAGRGGALPPGRQGRGAGAAGVQARDLLGQPGDRGDFHRRRGAARRGVLAAPAGLVRLAGGAAGGARRGGRRVRRHASGPGAPGRLARALDAQPGGGGSAAGAALRGHRRRGGGDGSGSAAVPGAFPPLPARQPDRLPRQEGGRPRAARAARPGSRGAGGVPRGDGQRARRRARGRRRGHGLGGRLRGGRHGPRRVCRFGGVRRASTRATATCTRRGGGR